MSTTKAAIRHTKVKTSESKAHKVSEPKAKTSSAQAEEESRFHISTKVVDNIGRIASVLSVIMYVSYITQIANNLGGHPGTPWQPLAAFFNCTMWTAYGWLKPKKDIPIIVANIPGIILGAITFLTAVIQF